MGMTLSYIEFELLENFGEGEVFNPTPLSSPKTLSNSFRDQSSSILFGRCDTRCGVRNIPEFSVVSGGSCSLSTIIMLSLCRHGL